MGDVRKEPEIENKTWLSGQPKAVNAFSVEFPQPSGLVELNDSGWYCDGFPTKSDLDTVCGSYTITFIIDSSNAQLEEYRPMIDKETVLYSLCKPFSYKNCFKSVEAGDVRPGYFLIEQPSPQLALVSVLMNRDTCDPASAQIPLLPLLPYLINGFSR